MQLLRLGLILLFSTQLLSAKKADPVDILKNDYTADQDVDAFKAALNSLDINPQAREIECMLADYSGKENKRNFLKKLIMSEEAIKQFKKKHGKKPENSDIESAYQALLAYYKTAIKQVYVAAHDKKANDSSKPLNPFSSPYSGSSSSQKSSIDVVRHCTCSSCGG